MANCQPLLGLWLPAAHTDHTAHTLFAIRKVLATPPRLIRIQHTHQRENFDRARRNVYVAAAYHYESLTGTESRPVQPIWSLEEKSHHLQDRPSTSCRTTRPTPGVGMGIVGAWVWLWLCQNTTC